VAARGEPQVQFKLEFPSCGFLSPCLLLPHRRLSWTQLWQHNMNKI
uniref:Uncharacterized protein n=1 Tax=Panthera tigris altaica TaxID=74533 RepID=A0A8C9KAY1_PANTA